MIVPVLLFMVSLAGVAAAVALPGLSDLVLLAAPCAIASLILILRAYPVRETTTDQRRRPIRRLKAKHIVIDGSNVMHWKDRTPQIETVRDVVQHLKNRGFTPGVVFDANAGHILFGKYQHHSAMGRRIGLPEDRVMVVQKGTPADPSILAAARDLEARIVTNDRYADWADTHPEVREPGRLIRGGYREGALWLDLETAL
jgi:Zc3h12a-like Ribonuclease NYN domain